MSALALLTLLTLAQAPAGAQVLFAEPPPIELWASEDWPTESLQELMGMPGVTLGVRTRSNMLRDDLLKALKGRRALVQLSPAIVHAHVEQYRALPRARLVLALPEKPSKELGARLEQLGAHGLRLLVDRLDSQKAGWIARLKNAEVELDLRGRIPDQEELTLLLGLDRARRVVRIRADAPAEIIEGLAAARLSRIVVEAQENRLPATLLDALSRQKAEVRVVLDSKATPADLLALAHLPQLSLEMSLLGEAKAEQGRVAELVGASFLQPREPDEGPGQAPAEGGREEREAPVR